MTAITQMLAALENALNDNSFVKLSLSAYKGPEPDLKSIHIRRIIVKREEKLSFTYRYKTRDVVKNHAIDESLSRIDAALASDFKTATLFTTAFDVTLENGKLKTAAPTNTEAPPLDHDRAKKRPIAAENKHYLHALNITDKNGKVHKNAQDKYRQINKYIELLEPHLKSLNAAKIADMGSGKGYLTFALYDYLVNTLKQSPQITGVEFRADLVALCNDIAKNSGFSGLHFIENSIQNYDAGDTNILIALHACDTATDDAIAKGIAANSDLIVAAPCCHKQIRREMEHTKIHNELDVLTRHGIFMERQAEMATDGLRALILEYFGYTVKVFEFISNEHTAKNIMIIAEKNPKSKPHDPAILKKIKDTKTFFGINAHYLEKLTGL